MHSPSIDLTLFQEPIIRFSAYMILAFTLLYYFIFRHPAQPLKAPRLLSEIPETYPILGAVRFFTARLEFFLHGIGSSASGNLCFWIGQNLVVGLSGIGLELWRFNQRGKEKSRETEKGEFSAASLLVLIR